MWLKENSSGYDDTAYSYMSSDDPQLYRDSIAQINMQAASETHIGDKTAFSASVTGAGPLNSGDAKSAENITLFISEPAQTGNAV